MKILVRVALTVISLATIPPVGERCRCSRCSAYGSERRNIRVDQRLGVAGAETIRLRGRRREHIGAKRQHRGGV